MYRWLYKIKKKQKIEKTYLINCVILKDIEKMVCGRGKKLCIYLVFLEYYINPSPVSFKL